MNTISEIATASLSKNWEALKKENPAIRIRDAAAELGVSEAELLATTIGTYTTRLEGEWTDFLKRLPQLGSVMSLTRNEGCVLEHKGLFQKIDVSGKLPNAMATVIGPIESRVFFGAWKFAFAVKQPMPKGLQQSLQIFDKSGTAITKIFLQEAAGKKPAGNQFAFDALVRDFTSQDQRPSIQVADIAEQETKLPGDVDKTALLADWQNMTDTHDFFGMLKKHQVNRLDAVTIAEGRFTYRIQNNALRLLLKSAAAQKLPIMIFAGNRGNLQIHQGKVQTIRVIDNWLNVLDPEFNMHLREDMVESTWVVKKPTSDGVVTGVEVFDRRKNMIAQFFGLRKPGIAEMEGWRKLVSELSKEKP